MSSYLKSTLQLFEYYKSLGEATFNQLKDEELFALSNESDNSIGIIVKHLWGNMLSRWTDFLNSDGEKAWRNRDDEFEPSFTTREEMIIKWEEGWQCLFKALNSLQENQLEETIYIRNMGHTVTEAINRQLAHYAYHVGQIVFLGKQIKQTNWESLSIPKGNSVVYNQKKFSKEKRKTHFTNDL